MAKKSKEYWINRQAQREELAFNEGTKALKEYQDNLRQAQREIDDKIAKLAGRYSNATGLDKRETFKTLRGPEFRTWRKTVGGYVNELKKIGDPNSLEYKKLSLELETLAFRSRISRLDTLKADIKMELIRCGTKNKAGMASHLTSVYGNSYKSLVEDLGVKPRVDFNRVKKVLGYEWSGKNYSSRIWTNTDKLAETIKGEIVQGINQGINYKTMSRRIAKKFNTSISNAERLVRTETNYIHNQATLDGYKNAKVEKYQFSATLDERTSQTCADWDGEIRDVKDIAVGINYPPMHVRCRSTTIPVIDYEAFCKLREEDFVKEKIYRTNSFIPKVKKVIEKNYGELNAEEVVLFNERLNHIKERHPEVIEVVENNFNDIIENPDYILEDSKNKDSIWVVKNIKDKNINTVIKLSLKNKREHKKFLNSVITIHKIREKELRRVLKKHKILLTKD